MAEVDIIIASCGKSKQHQLLTQNAVNSCLNSEHSGFFNIIVVESCQDRQYNGCQTIFFREKEFNYHRSLNQGLLASNSKYACICNNDLLFHKGWASNIILAMEQHGYLSASPVSDRFHNISQMANKAEEGWQVGKHICGWCIFMDRDVLNITNDLSKRPKVNNEGVVEIGEGRLLDERVRFYYSDNIYKDHLINAKTKHVLVWNSRVDHIEGGEKTWRTIGCKAEKRRLTDLQKNAYLKAIQNL